MEQQTLLEALSEIEQNLKAIKSSSEQVDQVLASNSKINETLTIYAQNLARISTELGGVKDNVKKEISVVANVATEDAQKEVAQYISAVSEAGKALTSKIDKLQNVCSSLDTQIANQMELSEKKMQQEMADLLKSMADSMEEVKKACRVFAEQFDERLKETSGHNQIELSKVSSSFETTTEKAASDFSSNVKIAIRDNQQSVAAIQNAVKKLGDFQEEMQAPLNSCLTKIDELKDDIRKLKDLEVANFNNLVYSSAELGTKIQTLTAQGINHYTSLSKQLNALKAEMEKGKTEQEENYKNLMKIGIAMIVLLTILLGVSVF